MSLVETLPTPETETWGASCVEGDGTENDPGDIDPDGGDIAHGWAETEEPPPRQRWNFILKLVHKVTRYFRQRGLPEYSASETYPPGARVTYGDGVVSYQRIGTGTTTGTAPTDETKWMRWGYTEEQLDDKLGTISGTLAEGTITASNSGVVSYRRQLCFPCSTDKIVCARVEIHKDQSGNWSTTLTLSGAAAFENGATGAVVALQSRGAGNTGYPGSPLVIVASETTVTVSYPNGSGDLTGTDPVVCEVQIRGN